MSKIYFSLLPLHFLLKCQYYSDVFGSMSPLFYLCHGYQNPLYPLSQSTTLLAKDLEHFCLVTIQLGEELRQQTNSSYSLELST